MEGSPSEETSPAVPKSSNSLDQSSSSTGITGTVRYVDLEGGFYGIAGDDGASYLPVPPLSQAFAKDGLKVRFEAKPRTDTVTISMWGKPVEVMKIEAI